MEESKTCLICNQQIGENDRLMVLPNMPCSAQNIPTKEQLSSDHGITLELLQCPYCGLVQFACTPVPYYKHVIRAGGGSRTMIDLRRRQYSEFISLFGLHGKKIIEVGCGRGEFLKVWKEFDVQAVGLEYDADLVARGTSEGMTIYQGFADNEGTLFAGAPYDAFVQFNFLEHQPCPNNMLRCIYNNLTEDGVGLVTVPSLEYILEYDGYYELIKDHIAYYSEETLRFLFQKNGFELVKCETVNRDTHAILVRKRKKMTINSLSNTFDQLKKELNSYVHGFLSHGKKVAIWGASHQCFTLIPTLGLSEKIAYIIDSAPFKQGKFAPASHVPIVDRKYFFEEPVDSILIVAPGYTDEIVHIIRTELNADMDIRALRSNHIEKI